MKLPELRNKIDIIDEQITKLLLERLGIAEEIGEYKRNNSITNSYDPSRETCIIENILKQTKNEQAKLFLKNIYEAIFIESKNLQNLILRNKNI